MGQLSLCKACFMSWALILMHSDAEPIAFLQFNQLTWDEARSYCQLCFKDLVTVTPNNTHTIAQNLSSDSWIGLRKYFDPLSNYTSDFFNFTSSADVAWTRWVNGDPLAFQNWYPGWPKFKPVLPQISCCSCSCTCPAVTTPLSSSLFPDATYYDATTGSMHNNSYFNLTDFNMANSKQPTASSPFASVPPTAQLPVGSACEKAPMPPPQLPTPDPSYIEHSCVAMRSNGAWIERNCTDSLPFVCYDERFYGTVSVSSVTASSAVLTWLPLPGNIGYYRLQVLNSTGNEVTMDNVGLNLTYNLANLLPGTRYDITVFASKCHRDVDNPQTSSFYTIPNKVKNLTVTVQTSTSITLNWSKPDGSMDFYIVLYNDKRRQTNETSVTVGTLTPGTLYNFTVLTGVNDLKSSEPVNISAFTKPDQVSNLTVYSRSNTSISLQWIPPPGGFTGYRLTFYTQTGSLLQVQQPDNSTTNLIVNGFAPGTTITINVIVLGNDDLKGETVTLSTYTAPTAISNLSLLSTSTKITASWAYSAEVYNPFKVEVTQSNGKITTYRTDSINTWIDIMNLKAAANYTVAVYSVINETQSTPVSRSIFTLPTPPTDANAKSWNTSQITFTWKPPANTETVTYEVAITSSFTKENQTLTVLNETIHTFTGLKSGTWYTFTVKTLAGDLTSESATTKKMTDPQPVQLSLAMMCSSKSPDGCDNTNSISAELQNILKQTFDGVYWALDIQNSENLEP